MRVRHQRRQVSLKMYDKHGLVLRIETTVNEVSFFKHHREVVHRDGTRSLSTRPALRRLRCRRAGRRGAAVVGPLTQREV